MQHTPESFEIKAVISQMFFFFKVIENYLEAFLLPYEKRTLYFQ